MERSEQFVNLPQLGLYIWHRRFLHSIVYPWLQNVDQKTFALKIAHSIYYNSEQWPLTHTTLPATANDINNASDGRFGVYVYSCVLHVLFVFFIQENNSRYTSLSNDPDFQRNKRALKTKHVNMQKNNYDNLYVKQPIK